MKALTLLLGLAASSMAASSPCYAQTRDQILAQIKRGEDFLKRIDEGAAPCFSDSCQAEKARILDAIFTQVERIPGSRSQTLQSAGAAIEVAQFMVDHPFLPPANYFPRNLKEWGYWWQKRYSNEMEYRNQWYGLVGEAFATWEALDLFLSRSRAPANERAMIQEAWDRGSAEISQLYHEQAKLMDRAGVMSILKKSAESKALVTQANEVRSRREKLEAERFGGRFRQVMEELYPQIEFKKICAAQARLKFFADTMRTNKLFSRSALEELSYWRNSLKTLNQLIQKYSDLEYGIVGIKNFTSLTNQQVAIEFEIPIQEFLDKVDFSGRVTASIAASYLMSYIAAAAGLSNLVFFGLSSGMNYASARYDFDFTEYLWDKSNRTSALESLLPQLKDDMERRWGDLLKARKALIDKISELKSQLEETNDNEGENS